MTAVPTTIKNTAIVAVAFIGIFASQYLFDLKKSSNAVPRSLILPAEIFRAVDLGLHSASASLAWLNVIQNVNSPRLPQLDEDIVRITDLDPRFSYPYAFGVLFLPTHEIKKPQAAIDLGLRGIERAEPDWRIPFYLAVVYHQYFNDSVNAQKYFIVASQTPGAPETASFMAASYGAKKSRREQTKTIWESIYNTSRDEVTRERAKAYLQHLENVGILETAIAQYTKLTGKPPKILDDLVTKKILKEVPTSSLGFGYMLDKNGNVQISVSN